MPTLVQIDMDYRTVGKNRDIDFGIVGDPGAILATVLQAASDDLTDAHEKETQAEAGWKAARDRAVKAEWTLHNLVLGSKNQVKAQYGDDSDEVNAVGLKKKSEYKRPVRKAKVEKFPKAA